MLTEHLGVHVPIQFSDGAVDGRVQQYFYTPAEFLKPYREKMLYQNVYGLIFLWESNNIH